MTTLDPHASIRSYESRVIGDRFHLARPPTVLARTASIAPIGFTRLSSDRGLTEPAKDVPPENAFSLHVALKSTAVDLWIDGKHHLAKSAEPGDAFLFDLRSNPVSQIHSAFDVVRFYISQASLDELAYQDGHRQITALAAFRLGQNDRTLHGLAMALLDSIEAPYERSALFIDHIALAFHAHVTRTYGDRGTAGPLPLGQLAPWQLRRAIDFIAAHLGADPTIAELAQQCGLSTGYFSRAFRRTTGVTPHQWLMRKRVERAQDVLVRGSLELAEVAIVCGFADQSHFSRVFTKFVGLSPGRWRQRNRKN
jgi:AraC family transcriptional regulator